MFKALKKTLDIDIAYSVNSFIYILRKLPILKDLMTNDAYSSKVLKKIIGMIGIVISFSRAIFLKFMYFFVLFYLSYKFFKLDMILPFYHLYFVMTLIGIFINNKLLNTSKKKYFSIILFNMDATKFFRANLFWNQLTMLILNSICIIFFFTILLSGPLYLSILLIIYTSCARLVGETLNIMFYTKYQYIWYSNSKLYFTILTILLGICALPFFKITISLNIITIVSLIFIILGLLSLIYLLNINDYKLMYKKLSLMTNVMNSKNDKDYLKQAMVEVKSKDKKIDNKKIEGKKGYDLFNTIFFERHKEILLRSAKKYSLIAIIIYMFLSYLILTHPNYSISINLFLHYKLSWFIIIMYFINRGAIITQAMFFNCDHAMLRYNFYREPQTIIELFKKRLKTIVKVNLLPAVVIAIGNIVLVILSNNYSIMTCLCSFLFIICLSIFFSVHYLVIYYLLQPFNKEMEVKKASYSFVTMFTYIISYMFTDLVMKTTILSVFGIVFTIIYIIISLILVYKLAPRTFKLN